MKFRFLLLRIVLALATLFGFLGVAQAASLVYQGQICWQNVSSYDQVVVHFEPNGNSDWDSNLTANGTTIGSSGQGSNYAGQSGYLPGNSISLGWVKVGGCPNWFCASYNPSIDYGQCNPTFEDTGTSPNEGYFWFEGYKYVNPTLSVSKSATPYTLEVGESGQYYSIYIGISNGPTSAAISIVDTLPAGFSTSGAITASGGTLSGCPSANATSLAGCTIAAGTYGPITITVPVNISAAAASSATNYAYVYGGGDPNCAGGCVGGTTNTVAPASPRLTITKALGTGGRINTNDQFTVQIRQGGTVVNSTASSTTSGSGTGVTGGTTGVTKLTAGTSYTVNEAAAGTTTLAQYGATVGNCSGTGASKIPATPGTAFSLSSGDSISCLLTNTPKLPTITLAQTAPGGTSLVFPVSYSYSGTNGWTTKNVSSTSAGLAGAFTTVQDLNAWNTDTVITPAIPAGLKISSAACTDSNFAITGNSSGALGSFTETQFTLPAAAIKAASTLVCNLVLGAANPTLTLTKAIGTGGRVNAADQFTVQILQGSTVVNATGNSTTTGSGSAVSGGSTGTFNATAGTTYTMTEVAASGNLAQYTSTVTCSNGAVGSTDVSGTTPLGRSITPALGDAISCIISNTAAKFSLTGKVLLDNGAGSGVAHDAVQNGTEPALADISLSLTNCAGTVYSTTTSAADGSFSLNLTGVPASQVVCMVQTLPGAYVPVSVNTGNAPGVITTTTSRSTTLRFTPAAYTNYSGVVLGNASLSTLTSNGEQQTTPGAAVTYSHLYTAASAGSVRFDTTDNPSPAGQVWGSVVYRDANCNGVLDASDTLLTAPLAVTAGQRICLLNRVITPSGAPSGMKDFTTLSATETWSLPTLTPGSQSNVMQNTDTTKVGLGGLTLLKEVRKLSANCPLDAKASTDDLTPYVLAGSIKAGDSLEYRLTYINNTAAPMTAIKLYDSVPAFTLFKGAMCLSWPRSISDCTVAQQPATDAASGSILWVMLDTTTASNGLQPLDSGTVSFCVKVQQ